MFEKYFKTLCAMLLKYVILIFQIFFTSKQKSKSMANILSFCAKFQTNLGNCENTIVNYDE